MVNYIEVVDIPVSHEFIKKHITFVLSEVATYEKFYEHFSHYFLRSVLSSEAFETLMIHLGGHKVADRQLKYLVNSLRRIFANDDHFKGIVGEHLFAFYFFQKVDDLLWTHGPKGRSSAEPGIDFVTFTGNETDKSSIKVTVWETKTTERTVSSRASQIYDFFSENGSFEENVDTEIKAIQEKFLSQEESVLKEIVSDLYIKVINREFCIGASGVSSNFTSTNETFKQFAKCFEEELTKEQRLVKLIFVDLLLKILTDLREKIWNKL